MLALSVLEVTFVIRAVTLDHARLGKSVLKETENVKLVVGMISEADEKCGWHR